MEHKELYIGIGFSIAVITSLIMRDNLSQPIRRGIPVPARRGIPVPGENVAMNNISHSFFGKGSVLNNTAYISANRQGPPSWVIRCLENNAVYTSQNEAAFLMDLPASEISRHLNGILDHVRGYHFERICMAA